MAEAIRPSIYTAAFGQDLCDAVVSAIVERTGTDPLALSRVLILLPNNRAIRAMTESFVRRANRGLLLPQMVAIGDLALDETLGPLIDPIDSTDDIPPAIAPMARLLLLTKLVTRQRNKAGANVNSNEALRLAKYLAKVIDELEIEQIPIGKFAQLDPGGDLAVHWQNSYKQLLDLLPQYYNALSSIDRIGPAARRNLLLAKLAHALRSDSNSRLVVAVGITTAAPAVARLLRTIALLKNSMVVLPAVDLSMDDVQWDKLGPHENTGDSLHGPVSHEGHPQYHLKLLLDRMGFQRAEILSLDDENSAKAETIRHIFCVPDETENWRDLAVGQKILPHVSLMVADDSAEEARAIAIIAREQLETPERRIAIITPDRELAGRVTAQLRRWNINVDDSAGTPLIQSPQGTLFMALAHGYADQFSPVSLLAIAKHPLVKTGEGRLDWLEQARILDNILRGPNNGIGLDAISRRIMEWETRKIHKKSSVNPVFITWWHQLCDILTPLAKLGNSQFSDILPALQDAASRLSEDAIWLGANGRQMAAFLDDLLGLDLTAIGNPKREALAGILTELFDGQSVRAPYGGHPRIAIYGLLEARLQRADILICAGLNEGIWPQSQKPDPWLAPRIRRELRLAGFERNIGLSAHDLATALGAHEVILTRAKRDRSGPTVASRFLLRVRALLGTALKSEQRAIQLARLLDRPATKIKFERPAVLATPDQRNVELNITDFDRLMADPFAFYAQKILRLRKLEPVNAEPSYAWRGSVVHIILERWAKEDACDPEKLRQRALDLLCDPAVHPLLRALWQPRIAEGLQWVAEMTQQLESEQERKLCVAEASGKTEIDGIIIKGRVDRIDTLANGGLAIVDYKTGGAPSVKQVTAGYALQLGLAGLMAADGGIKNVSGAADAFEYWSLAKNRDGKFGNIQSPVSHNNQKGKIDAAEFVAFAEGKARAAILSYIKGEEPFTAKLHPEYAPYADYDQLMRLEEWNGREPIVEGKV
jgi:ATP-dependent helicase/nuclease subunit B